MRFSCSAVDPDTTSEMPRVVEGNHATSDHAELPSVGVDDVEAPGGGRAAAAGEELDAMAASARSRRSPRSAALDTPPSRWPATTLLPLSRVNP